MVGVLFVYLGLTVDRFSKTQGIRIAILVLFCLLALLPAAAQDTPDTLPGRIAVIGNDSNVYVVDPGTSEAMAVTDDSAPTRQYIWPTWSNDGRLAYFCCDSGTTTLPHTQVYVVQPDEATGSLAYTSRGAVFTYAYWAPQDCADGDSCRDLAVLVSLLGDGRFGVDLVRSLEDSSSGDRIGRGSPFYFSWSPDGQRMLWHRNTRRVDVYTVDESLVENFNVDLGAFPAPGWSPVDDRLLIGTRSETGRGTDLLLIDGNDEQILVSNLIGEVAFNWSPDGNYVAYRTVGNQEISNVVVLDATTGEEVTNTASDEVLAFFWSPDSSKIAYVSTAAPPGTFNISYTEPSIAAELRQEDGLRFSVIDVESGDIQSYASFIPTSEMVYLLAFFNQFAQSHSIWSPDSTHLVFSEVMPGGQPVVSIMDVTRRDTVPFSVAEGVIGIWSYR